MGIYLNPTKIGFQDAVRSEIYVDKSELIAYTNRCIGTEQKFICVSRPRRFGKSMAAKMLSAYYCRTCDSRDLFANLKISKDASYKEHLNQYNVLFINMQRFLSRSADMEKMLGNLQSAILEDLREDYAAYFSSAEICLVSVLEKIYAKSEQGFIFIIDEWDCVFREKQLAVEDHKKYLDFLRDLLKDQPYIKLAYMTGILPVKKYGTHSALNMFDEYSMTRAGRLAEFAGFTETEVKNLCVRYDMDFLETKRWYDGYSLKNETHIYNPKSVVDAMRNQEFGSYWTSTESYEALKVYIDMDYDGLKTAIVQMLGGECCPVNTRTFTNDMTTFAGKDDVLTLLVHLGYLAFRNDTQEVYIPNEEVRGEFLSAMDREKWPEVIHSVELSRQLLNATLQEDAVTVAKGIDMVHMNTTSILQYNNENALSCVISLAYYTARDEYFLMRELPTGKGFADIVFLPRKHSNKPAIVVELKWDASAEGAIAQMKQKQYGEALQDYCGEVLLVGINYDKKDKHHQCMIEKMKK